MNDYKSAFDAAAADISAIIALLGFTKYPGVDPVLRAIADLILEKAENQVLREERDAALANVDALAVQVLKLGGTISFAHHRTDQAGQVPQAWLDVQAERADRWRRRAGRRSTTMRTATARWPAPPPATPWPAPALRAMEPLPCWCRSHGPGMNSGGSRPVHAAIWSRPAPSGWPRSNVSTGQAYRKIPSREPPRPLPEASPGWGENPNTQFRPRAIAWAERHCPWKPHLSSSRRRSWRP